MLHYKNQTGISWGLLSLSIALPIVLSQQPLLAQGFVAVVSNPTEVAKTNRSALSGILLFAVSAGSAGLGEIVIDYGIPIEDTGIVSDDSGHLVVPLEVSRKGGSLPSPTFPLYRTREVLEYGDKHSEKREIGGISSGTQSVEKMVHRGVPPCTKLERAVYQENKLSSRVWSFGSLWCFLRA